MNLYAYLISSFSHRNVQHESSNTLFYLILYQFNAVVSRHESNYFVCIIIQSNEQISTLCVGKR
ncbi:B5L [Variola virus]|uniref:B5L protein n=1 Tax=Variola virus (isolate Human/India/Ind3/1967) TaxID=587200 RepID=Q89188_VAR67|nr:hypothetical protein VARVgp173 [Variola virus]CAA49114.1 B5L [Variola virus]prf//2015436GV B5L gene [Variola major virus]